MMMMMMMMMMMIVRCLFARHIIEIVVGYANAGVNQVKIGSSKSISPLQIPYFFVVANILCAHESQKRIRSPGTNTVLAFGLAQVASHLTTTKPKILEIQMQQTNDNWHCMLSRLGHFHPNCISLCGSSLHFRNVQTMANYKQKLKS